MFCYCSLALLCIAAANAIVAVHLVVIAAYREATRLFAFLSKLQRKPGVFMQNPVFSVIKLAPRLLSTRFDKLGLINSTEALNLSLAVKGLGR